MTGTDARPLDHTELDVRYSLANTWNEYMTLEHGGQLARQELDEQADSISVRLAVPWRKRFWTSVEWKVTEHWGGWSDGPIEAWHSLIGAFDYQRPWHPRSEVHLVYKDDGGTAFDFHSPGFAPGDLTVRTQAALLDAPVALAARFDFKLPIGSLSSAGGSGGFDAGAGVVATWPFNAWGTVHALIALSRFSNLSAPTLLQPKEWHFTAEASFEARIGETTLLVEDRVLSPLLPKGWALAPGTFAGDDALLSTGLYAGFRAHNQISAGIRRGRFSFWMSEDFTPGPNPRSVVQWVWVSNAPDIVLGVAFTQPL